MASYAMFSPGRNWEQIRTTIAYNDQPVTIVGAHAGISVGPDGATHQALEDIGIMRLIPNMNVLVPCDAVEAKSMTEFLATFEKPAYLRLTREKTPLMLTDDTAFTYGKASVVYIPQNKFGRDYAHRVAVIACGPILYEALKAAHDLEKEGIGVTVVNMSTVKPLDASFLLRLSKDVQSFVTLEEAQVHGGLGSAVSEYMSEHKPVRVVSLGVRDRFGQSGKPRELYEEYGLTAEHVKEAVKKSIS
jgi:transketolase